MKNILRNKKKDIIIFIIISVITLIIFMPFLQKHYATDTYNIASMGYKEYAIKYSLKDGRILMAVIGFIAHITNIPIDLYVLILLIIALFTNCISIIILKNYILQIKNTNNLIPTIFVTTISYFTIFNFLYIENMLFVECFVMALSILFYILAAKTLISGNKHNIIKTIILVFIGTLCYQGTISMYLIAGLVFALIKNKEYKYVLKDLLIIGLILLLCFSLQMIIVKLNGNIFHLEQKRVSGINNILRNIIISLKHLGNVLIRTGYVYQKGLFLIFLTILEILILIKAYEENLQSKVIIDSTLIIFFGILFGICISFISLTAFECARIRISIGAIIGFLLLYLYCTTDIISYNSKKIINMIVLTIFVLYAITIIVNYISIMKNTIKVNEKDKQVALEIISYIENYENINNIKVDKIVVFKGYLANQAFYYELKYLGSVLSWKAIRTEWSIQGVLEKYSNRKMTRIEPDGKKLEFYINNVDKDKDYLCIDNTLYIGYYVY